MYYYSTVNKFILISGVSSFFLSPPSSSRSSVWFPSGRGPVMMSSSTFCHFTMFMALLTSCCVHSGWVLPASCCQTSILRRSVFHWHQWTLVADCEWINDGEVYKCFISDNLLWGVMHNWNIDLPIFPQLSAFLCPHFPLFFIFISPSPLFVSVLSSSPPPPLLTVKLSVWGLVINCPVWLCIWPMPTHGRSLRSGSIDELTLKNDSTCLAQTRGVGGREMRF